MPKLGVTNMRRRFHLWRASMRKLLNWLVSKNMYYQYQLLAMIAFSFVLAVCLYILSLGGTSRVQKPSSYGPPSLHQISEYARLASVVIETNRIRASGFFVGPDLLVTNYHVLKKAKTIKIRPTHSLKKIKVKEILGFDENLDLVLLRTEDDWPHYLRTASGGSINIGDTVLNYGSPKGIEGTFSSGILSNIRFRKGAKAYQITAPFSSGSSGGPVLNRSGEVIGVATAIVKGAQNLNVVIPIENITALVSDSFVSDLYEPLAAQVCRVASQVRMREKHFQRVMDADLGKLGLREKCIEEVGSACSAVYLGEFAKRSVRVFLGTQTQSDLEPLGSLFEHRIRLAKLAGDSQVIGNFDKLTDRVSKSKSWRVSPRQAHTAAASSVIESSIRYQVGKHCSVTVAVKIFGKMNRHKKKSLRAARAFIDRLTRQVERRLPLNSKTTINIQRLAQLSDSYISGAELQDEIPASGTVGKTR